MHTVASPLSLSTVGNCKCSGKLLFNFAEVLPAFGDSYQAAEFAITWGMLSCILYQNIININ